MKTVGKIAALAMTLSLAFVLSACGGSASSSAASSASSSGTTASPEASSAASAVASSAASASAASASAASASSESAAADQYTNEYFGIAYMLPSGWSFVDTAGVDQLNAQAAAVASGSALGMIAMSADGSSSVLVAIEEANSNNSGQTAETHLEAEVKQLTDSASGGNVSYSTETSTASFDGAETTLPAAKTKLTMGDSTIYMCQMVMEKDGDFMDIVIEGTSEGAVNEALAGFHLILE